MNPWHEKIALQQKNPLKIIVSTVEDGFPTHWHQEIEIVYVLHGEMQIGINQSLYSLSPGDLLFIGSCELHHYVPNPLGCNKIILQLGKSFFDAYSDLIFGHRFVSPFLSASSDSVAGNGIYGGKAHLHGFMERTILAIYEEWSERKPGHELVIKARMNDLAAAIIRHLPMEAYSHQEKIKRLEQLERLDKVLKYIEADYGNEITLQSAADVSGFSVTYFSRFFKEATGSNFVDYVNTYRTNVAMELLSEHEESVTEIAFRAGFGSIETFNRVFKKVTGSTPSAYRNKK
ncbi:AraC family transcriptional regulator [Cohnella endophytica]|uniref:AraC family transcriptional regulator n=1 Tax=Cohnella endophytica TaxID=2419778 RepID=A0A494XR15_9BACL|nr:AraC family transcriptional regulator [Cohnella endophytica]RKP53077.1 AraC family transcriptional regulator [Cohnella endophytica]